MGKEFAAEVIGQGGGSRILDAMGQLALAAALLTALALAPTSEPAALDRDPQEPRARVEHHLREAEPIVQHLETVLAAECPRFAKRDEWRAWIDDEIERVVLLAAHLEQAWVEAKQAPDDETRRVAKAPRKHLDRARALVDKLQICAGENGTSFAPQSVWRRVERAVPQRQMDIALPR